MRSMAAETCKVTRKMQFDFLALWICECRTCAHAGVSAPPRRPYVATLGLSFRVDLTYVCCNPCCRPSVNVCRIVYLG